MESTSTMNYNYWKKNEEIRRLINKHKTMRDKIIKIKSAITFLIRCRNSGIIPKFIRNSTKNVSNIFEVNGQHTMKQSISRYVQDMHNKILSLAIKEKHEILKYSRNQLDIIKRNLSYYFTSDEMNRFLLYEDRIAIKINEKIKNIHRKKFDNLSNLHRKELGIKFNKKWFVNKSNVDIPLDTQWVLSLGPKYSLPVRKEKFPILKMIADGEDFLQTIEEKEEQEISRSKFTTIIDDHINKMRLTNRDRFLLDKVKDTRKFLKNNKDIIILNADKGNTTVAMEKCDYVSRMNDIVGDITTYKTLVKDPTSKLQKTNNDIVEELFKHKVITSLERNYLKTNVTIAPRLYGVPKIHKENFPLRPICSFMNSPSYGLCKYITNILRNITKNSIYNVRDSLHFKNKLSHIKIHNNEKLISLDVVSLFPSIPIDLAICIIEEKWDMIREHTKMEKNLFLRILKFCITDNRYFRYDNKIYIQQKGLPMGSPASPVIADIVMEKLLDTCIEKLAKKPKIITKYVDDLFCIVSEDEIDHILINFNSFHKDIKFTIEKECDSKLSYLDTLIIRRGNKLLMDWYQKPTSSGRIINYYSKHPKRIIINTAKNLIGRILTISDLDFHRENKRKIIDILDDNNFPRKIIYSLIGQYKGQRGIDITNTNQPRIYKSLIYVPKVSERLERSKIFENEKYKMTHKTYNTLGNLFSKTKDKIDNFERSNVVYKIPCKGNSSETCDKVYIGTTKNKLKTRIAGHKSDQKYRNNVSQKTALTSHCVNVNHDPDFKNTTVLNTENNYKRRYLLEMLQIINTPITKRINYKSDTEGIAQNYRYLVQKF